MGHPAEDSRRVSRQPGREPGQRTRRPTRWKCPMSTSSATRQVPRRSSMAAPLPVEGPREAPRPRLWAVSSAIYPGRSRSRRRSRRPWRGGLSSGPGARAGRKRRPERSPLPDRPQPPVVLDVVAVVLASVHGVLVTALDHPQRTTVGSPVDPAGHTVRRKGRSIATVHGAVDEVGRVGLVDWVVGGVGAYFVRLLVTPGKLKSNSTSMPLRTSFRVWAGALKTADSGSLQRGS